MNLENKANSPHEKTSLPSPHEKTSLPVNFVQKDAKKKLVVVGNRKYELTSMELLPDPFPSRFSRGEKVLKDDFVYRVSEGKLKYQEPFPLPSFSELAKMETEERNLLFANYYSGLVPYEEKILTKETMPAPLWRGVWFPLFWAGFIMTMAVLIYIIGFATWHVLLLAGIYSSVFVVNFLFGLYYAKTRNFKIFSGVVSAVNTKLAWSKSLRRSYIQITNGRKFLSFRYHVAKENSFPPGTPVTIFFANSEPIYEGAFGPTIDNVLSVYFSVDVKGANKHGEYQDGHMKNQTASEFFEDE